MKKSSRPWMALLYAAAAACAAAGLFFLFALVGYQFLGWTLVGVALLLLAFRALLLLPRRWPARTLAAAALALVFLGLGLEVPIVRAARGSAQPGADYLIVLGAAVNGEAPSMSLRERLDAALAYLQDSPGCVAVLSGGQGPGELVSEGRAMADYLLARGIDARRLILEEQATNTAQNIALSLALLQTRGVDVHSVSIAVCSSEYHLFRAGRMAALEGVDVTLLPAATALPLLRLNYFLRESAAVAHLYVLGY